MIYNIHYDVCAIIISLLAILFVIVKKGFRRKQNKILFALFIITLICSFFDIFSAVANSYVDYFTYFVRDILNYSYLLCQNLMPFLFCHYVISLTAVSYSEKNRNIFHMKVAIPCFVSIILLFTNPFTKLVFYYDANKVYTHGFAMSILYALAMCYMLLSYYVIKVYGKSVPTDRKVMVYTLLTASMIAVIVQIIFPNMLIELCIISLSLLGALFTLENDDEITDYITTCYNRRAFIYDNTLYFKSDVSYYIVVVKLTNLRYYYTTMGILAINGFLKNIGIWLRSLDEAVDVFYCDNGHFALICKDVRVAEQLKEKIIERFNDNWILEGIMLRFRIQLWIAKIPKDIQSLEQLLFVVDASVQQSTLEKGNEILAKEEVSGYKREIAVEQAIERALKNRSFEVYYQPIWNAKSNSITSGEALVRLYDDKLGFIPPDEFISLAEKKGYIIEIGEFVFDSVCRFFAENKLKDIGISYIEVNLSVVQCMSEKLVDKFCSIIDKYGIDSSCINLEITESAMANNVEVLESTMKQLFNKGFTFSMDDYGTGYSNFSYVFEMPFKIVKLDKSILWKAVGNKKASIVLANTLHMFREMNMETVVEGVETEDQMNMLKDLGCDYIQGYYFSKAIPEKEFYNYCVEFNSKQVVQ